MADREYFVVCAAGLEEAVAGELLALGAHEIQRKVRGVSCVGPPSLRYRANLWLRAAIRVLEPLLRADVTTPQSLYDAVRSIDWSEHLGVEQKISIDGHVRDSDLTHSGFAALKAKDAIVDQFRDRFGARPDAGPDGADLPVVLHLFRNRMTLSRDTSGETLHKRGYRDALVKSPLNEALAAGILEIARWDGATPIADPMCGSGTFAIEAAMMAAEMAPGLARASWPFERWPDFSSVVWKRLRDEAKARAHASLPFPIFASDHHAGALSLARKSARTAGVESMIRFALADIADFKPDPMPKLLVLNPPYGERLEAGPELYRKIGTALRRFPGTTAWVLSGNRDLTRHFGMKASRHVDLLNGDIECRLLRYDVFGDRVGGKIEMRTPLWTPSDERVREARITRYARFVGKRDYAELWRWSVEDRAAFWKSIWEFGEVRFSKPYERIVENPDTMPGAKWFVGARLNFAENLLRRRDAHPALVFQGEGKPVRSLTYAELYDQVARLATSLRGMGIRAGDRVAGFVPNLPEAVVAMLAAAAVGAVWSSCSPDFGIQGVLDRFGQIAPRVLFTADGATYGGKNFDSLERISGILERLPSVEKVVVVPYLAERPDLSRLPKAVLFDDFLARGRGLTVDFEQLPFDHPLYILYSSGTTGIPKCIVHGAGGTLLQHIKELWLHTDVSADSRIFYFTTCGWMMWNWLASALTAGATVLLYDGSPFHPDPEVLWRFAESQKMTVFGTSAKYLAALEKEGVKPARRFDLSSLRTICSTGSPLSGESFEFVYRDIKKDVCLSSISGGTDIISCFALGNPTLPVYAGELQCRGLGMKVDVFDAQGRSVRGEKGELVCTAPFVSMPVYFWNDPDGKKYRATYFERYPGAWHHGDFAELTEHDGLVITGRSDATLKPGGVRIGTADIYRQVESVPEILDSVVVGQDWENDVRIVLFVKLRPGATLTEELVSRIKKTIRENTTPRHVPAKILSVAEIPYTISGKKVELAVREVIHGRPVANRDALADPQALELYKDRPELRG